jgi:2-polyprenyl-6-methoxyphenol hydroxylase-like FAD-dependent oxidoreductase
MACDAEAAEMRDISVSCCVVGGGPAGMMAGYLLARAGVSVAVLEKHADFLRDFRGDTIHPSTLQVMEELGLYNRLLERPHYKAHRLKARVGASEFTVADFSRLPTRAKFIAFMPQWDFLDFLAGEAKSLSNFRLFLEAEATGLIEGGGKVAGVAVESAAGPFAVRALLVIGCDGRHAMTRKQGGFKVEDIGAPMDVLWFRLSRRAGDPEDPAGSFGAGHIVIMIDRGDYWQCGYVIEKGSFERIRERGLDAFRAEMESLAPFLKGRTAELTSFDAFKLLTVGVDRLKRWHRPGLLCIGDAAHTMSPVGGVGINLAIQDAVAAANLLAAPLREVCVDERDLARVQKRRETPTRLTQWLQVRIQNNVIKGALDNKAPLKPPLPLRLMARFPWLARIPARIIGLGFRPEHVDGRIFSSRRSLPRG